ncbi:LolA-like putative outer membrane lipoprotein chaperone [Prevotella sp.]|uniref:LolA-like putative outer membrane lipoprotein chaperone n=1 Tax=uncultured Prevotella sp. TaxID=159272 RepID=UPI0025F3AB92|nr:LolA-like putative outer membrane lipoprotein chaperone [uncultured Prevotella sp.]MBN2914771.1 outer-membrane lipoprotein carrier protein LolA [Prevotella sp.]
MKHTLLSILLVAAMAVVASVQSMAQSNPAQARAILDKTSKVIGHKSGVSAAFTLNNPTTGNVSGTIAVKGGKFNARTPQAIVWFNGKTQWTYMKKNNEVNISIPTQAQQQMMNPYTFINVYKTGYKMSSTKAGGSYEVHLVAQNQKRSIQEMYVTVNSKTYVPSRVKMKHNGRWYTVTISNFSAKKLPDSLFAFNSKDYPSAEVIDLR